MHHLRLDAESENAVTEPAASSTARISARTKRQALDWSLVLASQGIECVLDHSEDAGWALTVATPEFEHARAVIHQYRIENLRWPWRRKIRAKVVFDWGSLAWVFLISVFFWLQQRGLGLEQAGLMESTAVSHGQWWRLVTAIFLHANLGHLAENAGIGWVLLGLTMGRYGTGIGLLAGLLAGIGGNVATWLVFAQHRSLGASGMVMGCLGLLAAQSVALARRDPRGWKYFAVAIGAGFMLFALMGTSPGSDVLAHLGGFVSGILLGSLLILAPRTTHNAAANLLASMIFVLLVLGSWWCAVTAGG